MHSSDPLQISVVVPLFNERQNVEPLCERIISVCQNMGHSWELVLIDDGSTDGTAEALDLVSARDPRVVSIHFRRNYGQTAAMQAGFEAARGSIVVTMDGDLQNDPADIPMLIQRLDEGFDLVHGWRRDRHDAWATRKLPSRIANWLIGKVTEVPVHDLGCALKVFRREVVDELDLYGEMHRFIAILAFARGAKVLEVPVRHHARQYGVSKYGLGRTTRVVLDLMTVKFLTAYLDRPMKLLGRLGLASLAGGMIALMMTILMKLVGGTDMTGNPFLLLSAVMGLMSLQLMGLGLLGEMNTRMYYLRSGRRPFAIRRVVGTGLAPSDSSPLAA